MSDLERARTAYAEFSWLEAAEAFEHADDQRPLDAEDLELFATTIRMRGRDEDAVPILERAHHRYLERGEKARAAYCASWIGMSLAYHGAVGPASGWLARAERLLDEVPEETAVHGYLLLPRIFRQEAAGDLEGAAESAREAAERGKRFDDDDLFALGLHMRGQMLIKGGRIAEGLACLDEAMVTVTTAVLSPFVVGLVYCGVILACNDVFEVNRAREWTVALTEWAEKQRDLVGFTGRCLVHRAEILQLGGSWTQALEEARLASERLIETNNSAAGLALYREGELLRLLGDFTAAEVAYREASRFGWEPQPGFAQLRLAQGRRDAALAAIRRASSETGDELKRVALLPAYVEIALAVGEVAEARQACDELRALAETYESAMVDAMVAYAEGAVALVEGDANAALMSLREAGRTWRDLDAPYEIARTRALAARACSALGDEEAGALELASAREIFEELGARPDLERLAPGRAGTAHGLSARELEVLRLVAAGRTNREIAETLVLSEHTVARHLQNIYAKLGLTSRTAATAFAFERNLV
jgi:ATP/maltotriose-dependent transcriptional regulator MalT